MRMVLVIIPLIVYGGSARPVVGQSVPSTDAVTICACCENACCRSGDEAEKSPQPGSGDGCCDESQVPCSCGCVTSVFLACLAPAVVQDQPVFIAFDHPHPSAVEHSIRPPTPPPKSI